MDSYPPDLFYHYKPLVFVSGLTADNSVHVPDNPLVEWAERITVEQPLVGNDTGKDLLRRFKSKCPPLSQWERRLVTKRGGVSTTGHLLNLQFVGRTIKLPPLKSTDDDPRYPNKDIHSILSPLNPRSKLYPNGLITEHWVQKYLYLLPSTVVSVHSLQDIKSDDEFCSEIVALKTFLTGRGIKLIVIITADDVPEDSTSDQILYLRRTTGLATRTSLFYLPQSLDVEKDTLVESVCQLAYNNALDFMVSAMKRIKRKMGRPRPPQSDLSSEDILPLPSIGWEIRYNFKLATLAELRQDTQTAMSTYESAYDASLELLEVLSSAGDLSDQPELWKQARLILDVVAYKILKLCLYMQLPNVAYRKFNIHLDSVTKIIEQKGYSSQGYAHVNWLATQYRLLAGLVGAAGTAAVPKSKAVAPGHQDNGPPGALLPRSGFLYLSSVDLIESLPDIADGGDPYFSELRDFEQTVKDSLEAALNDFSADLKQTRVIEYVMYRLAELHHNQGDHKGALSLFKRAADSYRRDGWKILLLPVLKCITDTAAEVGNAGDYLLARLEYLSLGGDAKALAKAPEVVSDPIDITSLGHTRLFEAEFVFESPDIFIGTETRSQLTIIPLSTCDLTLNYIKLEVTGRFDPIIIEHDAEGDVSTFCVVSSKADKTNLVFSKNKPRIFELKYVAHQLGEVAFKRLEVEVADDNFKYRSPVNVRTPQLGSTVSWFTKNGQMHLRRNEPLKTRISPRPSRVVITNDASSTVIAGEIVTINFTATNEEDEQIELELDGHVNHEDKEISVEWISDRANRHEVGEKHVYTVKFQIPLSGMTNLNFDLQASYRLTSDQEIIVKDSLNISIPISKPFRVNFDVQPRIHYDEWSSIFVPQKSKSHSPVIYRRWALSATVLFLGQPDQKVQVLGQSLDIVGEIGSKCEVVEINPEVQYPFQLVHNEGLKIKSTFDVSMSEPKEPRNVNAAGYLKIKWKRVQDNAEENEFHVPAVKLVLPLYMPRVLVDLARTVADRRAKEYELVYYLENATSHILSYDITMGTSHGFAFQGPKTLHLRVLPFTRHRLEYTMVALSSGNRKLPGLQVYDPNYKRTLMVIPAHDGIKSLKGELFIE